MSTHEKTSRRPLGIVAFAMMVGLVLVALAVGIAVGTVIPSSIVEETKDPCPASEQIDRLRGLAEDARHAGAHTDSPADAEAWAAESDELDMIADDLSEQCR